MPRRSAASRLASDRPTSGRSARLSAASPASPRPSAPAFQPRTTCCSRYRPSSARLVGGMLDQGQVEALTRRLDEWSRSTTLPELVRAADPEDEAAVAAVAGPVTEVTDAIRTASTLLVGGMAFGEAALVHAELP